MSETLAGLGEGELLRRLARFAPAGQLWDDTAALNPDPRPLLVNTDVLVDRIHFSDTTTAPEDVGWRAVAANFSDLAASGAVQVDGITVALVAPGETSWHWVEGVYRGLATALASFGGVLLGGDCSCGEQRLLSITALGRQGPLRLHRGDALPGDWLVTSGTHGLSRLGLALLQDEPLSHPPPLTESLRAGAIQRHRHPIPRFDALTTLLQCKPDHCLWRAGGTDSSDGLLAAVEGLCSSSHCGAVLEDNHLPRAQDWPDGEIWDQWCLAGGEDFELVLSLPPDWAQAWLASLPGSHRFGTVTEDPGTILWKRSRQTVQSIGFDHFNKNPIKNPP